MPAVAVPVSGCGEDVPATVTVAEPALFAGLASPEADTVVLTGTLPGPGAVKEKLKVKFCPDGRLAGSPLNVAAQLVLL